MLGRPNPSFFTGSVIGNDVQSGFVSVPLPVPRIFPEQPFYFLARNFLNCRMYWKTLIIQ